MGTQESTNKMLEQGGNEQNAQTGGRDGEMHKGETEKRTKHDIEGWD